MRRLVFIALILVCSNTLLAREAAPWTLTKADFSSQTVTLQGIDDKTIRVIIDGTQQTLGQGEYLQLERVSGKAKPAVRGDFVLHFVGGERLGGRPVGMKGNSLLFENPDAGQVPVAMSQIAGITRTDKPLAGGAAAEDVVTLGNGDVVRGIINTIADGKIEVQTSGGAALPIPLDSVASVQFATTAGGTQKAAQGFRIRLDDGSAFPVAGLKLESAPDHDGKLEIRFADDNESRPIALSRIAAIEQLNGPAVFLSSLEPQENVYTPFLGTEQDYPARMNQTADGNRELVFGGKTFRQAIGVHSHSRLAWNLNGSFSSFRTQYAIAEDKPRADVTVRILLDDKVVHEKKNVRAGTLSPVVSIELGDAKKLTLEVDYGENLFVDDHLTWLSPALLRKKTQ